MCFDLIKILNRQANFLRPKTNIFRSINYVVHRHIAFHHWVWCQKKTHNCFILASHPAPCGKVIQITRQHIGQRYTNNLHNLFSAQNIFACLEKLWLHPLPYSFVRLQNTLSFSFSLYLDHIPGSYHVRLMFMIPIYRVIRPEDTNQQMTALKRRPVTRARTSTRSRRRRAAKRTQYSTTADTRRAYMRTMSRVCPPADRWTPRRRLGGPLRKVRLLFNQNIGLRYLNSCICVGNRNVTIKWISRL